MKQEVAAMSNQQLFTPLPLTWKRVYFLGIGGIGMSGLARYFKAHGVVVSGYDRTPGAITTQLINEGIAVHFDDNPELIPANLDAAIYTPAVPAETAVRQHIESSGIPVYKRAQVLAMITEGFRLLAVAGTHGKTSVSAMLAHILNQSQIGCNAIIGGIARNYDSNLLLSKSSHSLFVTEADEFDRSFLQLNPWLAVITSTDADHLDIYNDLETMREGFSLFTRQVNAGGRLLIKAGIELDVKAHESVKKYYYSADFKADFCINRLKLTDNRYHFDLLTPFGEIEDIILGVPGLMNVENAVAASAAAILAGENKKHVKEALESFMGVKRRFDHRIISREFVYIDDYAHHPTEINACLRSVRHLYPGRTITTVFQPHLYSRTRDFAAGFAESLSESDRVILLEIYPAREKPITGVNSEMLLKLITTSNKELLTNEELLNKLPAMKPDILITMGAGDIDRLVEPIEQLFKNPTCRC